MRIIVGVIVVAFVAAGFSRPDEGGLKPAPTNTEAAPQKVDALALYKTHCIVCHGPAGKSPLPDMSFVGKKWKHGSKTADIVKIVTDGAAGTPMLPFGSRLTRPEIAALAKLVRSYDKTLKPEKR